MGRIYNFSAGPAALPESVLREAQADLVDWQGRGLSVMEMSHRGAAFADIAARAEADLRTLLGGAEDYAVLFLQGGATTQFWGVPRNLLSADGHGDYVVTGAWSRKALAEAKAVGEPRVAATSERGGFTDIPPRATWDLSAGAGYVHVTLNETIGGVEFHDVPDVGDVPLVADASSCFLSRPLDVSSFGVIYAGAQKNIGPAGVTIVLVRRDLLGRRAPGTPMTLDWTKQAEKGSMLNTPPCWAWYVSGLVFRQLLDDGGLEAMGALNDRKAAKLYAAIDTSPFYRNPVAKDARSRMNVPFILEKEGLDQAFLAEAERAGLHGLKGHRSVGGMRASIYNAVPEAAVDALIAFMKDFETRHAG